MGYRQLKLAVVDSCHAGGICEGLNARRALGSSTRDTVSPDDGPDDYTIGGKPAGISFTQVLLGSQRLPSKNSYYNGGLDWYVAEARREEKKYFEEQISRGNSILAGDILLGNPVYVGEPIRYLNEK